MSRHEENRRKIEFLSQYINAGKEYDEVIEAYEYYRQKIVSLQASVLSDMPRSASVLPDKIGGHIAKLEELENIIHAKLSKLEVLRIEVENVIGRVEDSLLRRLLHLKYLDVRRLTWEKICVQLNYSWAQTHRLHSKALSQIVL